MCVNDDLVFISQSVLLFQFQAIVELKGSKELNMVIRKGTVSSLRVL